MTEATSVTLWIREAAAGRADAVTALWQRYHAQLIGLARRRLAESPRRVADEDDVVVDAFDSFYRGMQAGRFPVLNDRDDLWQILIMLTARKAANQRKHLYRQKRGGGHVRGDSFWMPHDDDEQQAFDAVAGAEPSPEFAAEVTEEYSRLLDQLSDATLQQVAVAKMEGYSNDEIASQLGVKTRTVERKLALIRDVWGETSSE